MTFQPNSPVKRFKQYHCIYDSHKEDVIKFTNALKDEIKNLNLISRPEFFKNNLTLPDEESCFIILGGDGFMLRTLHELCTCGVGKINAYGINFGTLGFLLNENKGVGAIMKSIQEAKTYTFRPINVIFGCKEEDGQTLEREKKAINDFYLTRSQDQTCDLSISINNRELLPSMRADGVLLCTPAGSTAYNFSLHGPIIPPNAKLLSLMPISPFRPRHWRGSLIHNDSIISIKNNNPQKRSVDITIDYEKYHNVQYLYARLDGKVSINLLFNSDFTFEQKVLEEQFSC